MNPQPKRKPWRSHKYLEFVRTLPCCVCGAAAVGHHEQELGQGALASKTDDFRAIPMCPSHHGGRHGRGRSFWKFFGINPELVVKQTQDKWVAKYNSRPWEAKDAP